METPIFVSFFLIYLFHQSHSKSFQEPAIPVDPTYPYVYGEDYLFFPSDDGPNGIALAVLHDNVVQENPNKADPDPKDVHLYLYTRSNPEVPEEMFPGDLVKLGNSRFRKNKPLKILGHGFASSYTSGFPANSRKKYLEVYGDINVITIEWSILAEAPFYPAAVKNVELVGTKTGALVTFLLEQNYITLDKVHYVGHSLGAHVGGATARHIKGGKMARITGLDPAKPGWENNTLGLNRQNAEFVDIVHTCGSKLGLLPALGDVDFYPNGGEKQPNCGWPDYIVPTCSHSRAHEYFLESIKPEGSSGLTFGSCECSACQLGGRLKTLCISQYANSKCNCYKDPWVQMGEHIKNLEQASGYFLLITNGESPFSKLPVGGG